MANRARKRQSWSIRKQPQRQRNKEAKGEKANGHQEKRLLMNRSQVVSKP
jgi:hypothetical protein